MKNSTLLFRSLIVIILIAGSAHLVTYASQNNARNLNSIKKNTFFDTTVSTDKKETPAERNALNSETDYIIGRWKVKYNSTDFNGAVIYEMKKEKGVFNAYIFEYHDENGNSQKAENLKTLVIKSFDGYKGKGQYIITYEGKKYNVDCTIDMLDENTFKLSYDYYGYSDVETWIKQ